MESRERTQFAMQAIGLADLFKMVIGPIRIGGTTPYRVELSAPEGPSTGGGKQAVQHIKLIPERGGVSIVAGAANPVERSVELRSWNRLAEIHGQRFKGTMLPLDMVQYGQLLKSMKDFFAAQNLPVVMLESPPPEPAAAAGGSGLILMLVIGLLAGGGVATYFLTR